jgi:hypothetical protein
MRSFLLVAAIAVIVGFGAWEALWTDRWSSAHEAEQAAGKLAAVPRTVGNWVGSQDGTLDPRQVAVAEMTGYLLRSYTNNKTGSGVQVLIVAGRPGPTSLHSPDICYAGLGYSLVAPPAEWNVKGLAPEQPAGFWMADFQKAGATPEPLRIRWSWSTTGAWIAATHPRWTFGSEGFLYKLYVARAQPKLNEPLADDPTEDFLRFFLPQLNNSLFPQISQSSSSLKKGSDPLE